MLLLQILSKEVDNIDRRNFFFTILSITIVGTVGLVSLWFYYAFANSKNNTADSEYHPEYLSSMTAYGGKNMLSPMGVASYNKKLYVLDTGNKQIAVFSQNGPFKKSISLSPVAGENTPVGITVDNEERIYVSMIGSANKIAVFNDSGKFLYYFPQKNQGKDEKTKESVVGRAVALFSSGNKIYITDVVDQNIKVFDKSGKLLLEFGYPGNKKGAFLYPNGITVSNDEKIFISDSNNARVQVFDQNGRFLFMFSGSEKNRLALPRGLAFDNKRLLHVVDTLKHKVFVFNSQGKPMYDYGFYGKNGPCLSYPNSIVFDDTSERAYIADKLNNRISVWKP